MKFKLALNQFKFIILVLTISTFSFSRIHAKSKYRELEIINGSKPEIKLEILEIDEIVDLSKEVRINLRVVSKELQVSIPSQSSFKINLYFVDEFEERHFISNQSTTLNRGKKNKRKKIIMFLDSPPFRNGVNKMHLDLYDTEDNYINTYFLEINGINESARLDQDLSFIKPIDCEDKEFGECQLDYLFSKVSFEIKKKPQISTRVRKIDGNYKVIIPIKTGNLATVTRVSSNTTISPLDDFLSLDTTTNSLNLGRGDALTVHDDGNIGVGIKNPRANLEIKAGSANLAPIKLNPGDLTNEPDDGCFEFDGSNLYFTAEGIRKVINNSSSGGEKGDKGDPGPTGSIGSQGPAGIQGPQGIAGSINGGTIENLLINGSLTITNGATADFILVSDANGLASWTNADTLNLTGDNLGDHAASQNIDLANNDIVNAATITASIFNGVYLGDGSALTGISATTGNATTLDTLDSSQLLRSDSSDSFSSGTLTTDLGTTVNVDGDLNIADTNITLDGNSATFTQTTGDIDISPASGSDFNVNLDANGDMSVGSDLLFIESANGNIGLSNSDPQAKLDINGQILIKDGNQATGKILVSDSNGLGTWTTINSDLSTLFTATSNATLSITAGSFTNVTNMEIASVALQTGDLIKLTFTGSYDVTGVTLGAYSRLRFTFNGTAYGPILSVNALDAVTAQFGPPYIIILQCGAGAGQVPAGTYTVRLQALGNSFGTATIRFGPNNEDYAMYVERIRAN